MFLHFGPEGVDKGLQSNVSMTADMGVELGLSEYDAVAWKALQPKWLQDNVIEGDCDDAPMRHGPARELAPYCFVYPGCLIRSSKLPT